MRSVAGRRMVGCEMVAWPLFVHEEVRAWLHGMRRTDRESLGLISAAIEHVINGKGPAEGRPLVDRVKGSNLHNLKELRPASGGATEVRILFIFDSDQRMVFLVGGDKSGSWKSWYDTAIALAEERYKQYEQDRGGSS